MNDEPVMLEELEGSPRLFGSIPSRTGFRRFRIRASDWRRMQSQVTPDPKTGYLGVAMPYFPNVLSTGGRVIAENTRDELIDVEVSYRERFGPNRPSQETADVPPGFGGPTYTVDGWEYWGTRTDLGE